METLNLTVDGLALGAVYAIVAMSFAVVFSVTKTFHFALGAFYLLIGYFVAYYEGGAVGFIGAAAIGVVLAVVLSVLTELLLYSPLRRRGATGLTIFVASLGLLIVVDNITPILFGAGDLSLSIPGAEGAVTLGGVNILVLTIVQCGVAAVVVAGFALMMRSSSLGKAFRAVADNPSMATLIGVNSRRKYVQAFAISGLVLGIGAVLGTASSGAVQGNGDNMILVVLIAVIVGGVSSIPGAAAGGLLIGLAESVSALWVSPDWALTIAFGLCMIFIVFRPRGFFGKEVLESKGAR